MENFTHTGSKFMYGCGLIWTVLGLKHGADVNAKDNMQQTALHWAAVRGSIAAADVLVDNGARVEAADVNGYRVLFSLDNAFFQLSAFFLWINIDS